MKILMLIFFLASISESYCQLDNAKSISKALKKQYRSNTAVRNFTNPSGGWYRIDSQTQELLKVQEFNNDTIINYTYLNNKLVRIDFGFKPIYALYYFKDGAIVDQIERKNWHIINIEFYREKGETFLNTLPRS